MRDEEIVSLYWQRDERAIIESHNEYGRFCRYIAINILSVREDAEECVNDTWNKTWNSIPPQRPGSLRAYLGRIVRNLSINRWHKNRAQKRYNGLELMLSELEECIPAPVSVEQQIEAHELSKSLDNWLDTLPDDDRALFVRRYWYGDPLNDLAKKTGVRPEKLAQRMYRIRKKLKAALEREGIRL